MRSWDVDRSPPSRQPAAGMLAFICLFNAFRVSTPGYLSELIAELKSKGDGAFLVVGQNG